MTESEIIMQFNDLEVSYKLFKDEVISYLKELKEKHSSSIDIHSITERMKTVDSIAGKFARDKDGKYKDLLDIHDVIGTRVVCHCLSDLSRLETIMDEDLDVNYSEIDKKSHNKEDGYRSIHYTFKKDFDINGKLTPLTAEIQIRTVLQDAWAIQSHIFGYKGTAEGDADILKKAMSGILDNCETLWELVKRDVKAGKDTDPKEIALIVTDTTRKVKTFVEQAPINIEKFVSDNRLIEIENYLKDEYRKVSTRWNELYSARPDFTQIVTIFDELESLMPNITAVGLYAIKYNNLLILKKVFKTLENISSLADEANGYTTILSIPRGLLHNSFYYFGIYAVQRLNGEMVDFLITAKIERNYNGRLNYYRIWESALYMAPEVFHGADQMFNRLMSDYPNNKIAQNIIEADKDEFTNLAITFNLLFCLKGKKEKEERNVDPWAYPNFARYYGHRLQQFIDRIKNREEYQDFITTALKENIESLGEHFNDRIRDMSARGLGNYSWNADFIW